MFVPHHKKKSLTALLSLLSKLGINCRFANLTIAVHTRGYDILLKGSERDKNTSDHRKKEFKP